MSRRPIKRRPLASLKISKRRPRWPWLVIAIVVIFTFWMLWPASPDRLRSQAMAAERSGDWPAAFQAWQGFNRTTNARASTCLSEAKAALAINRALAAEVALRRAIALDPSSPDAWHRLLELLRVEDRPLDALRDGRAALIQVPIPADRLEILRRLTLALLAELPDDVARPLLDRWIAADSNDVDALVAKLGRVAAMPRSDDPDRAARIATLETKLRLHPEHSGVREALVVALADAGEPERGRVLLDAWPEPRDARYYRLKGRWELDYDGNRPAAVAAFRRALADLPHDWKTHYRLARALDNPSEAAQAAAMVARLREVLEPATLGAELSRSFTHLNERRSRLDLAELCDRVGLHQLAEAWRMETTATVK